LHILIFVPKNGVPPVKNKKLPPQTMTKQAVDGDNAESNDSFPQENSTENLREQDPFANWPELTRLLENNEPVESLFEKGWRPLLKSKPNGKQYMTLRFHGREKDSGEMMDTERGIGILDPENPEKWDALIALFEESKPPLPSTENRTPNTQSPPITGSSTSNSNRSSVLSSKVARVAPIAPTVQINLGTLQWYNWVQQVCGYPGKLDDFINDTVDSYFRAHHHLELAVVVQGGQN